HLKEDGVLSMHRWLFVPPRETLRLTCLACEAWKRHGVTDMDRRIMVIGRGEWAVSLFKNQAFTVQEVEKIRQIADKLDGQICYWPNVFPPDQQQKLQTDYYAKADEKLTHCNQIFRDCIHAYR